MATCMCTHHVCAWYLRRPEEVIRFPGTGVKYFELPCGCWELNPGPLLEQHMLLPSEQALQLSLMDFTQSQFTLLRNALKTDKAAVNLDSMSYCYDL